MPLTCPGCGYPNRLAAAFCGGCGARLGLMAPCPSCGGENRLGQRFCNSCGARLPEAGAYQESPPQHVAPAPEAGSAMQAADAEAAARPAASPATVQGAALAQLGLALLAAVAIFARSYSLADIPPGLHSSEEAVRRAASDVLERGWIGAWSTTAQGQPTGYVYWAALWMALLPDDAHALRFASGLVGLATLAVFYLFCRALFSGRAAVLGTVLLAFSLWHLHYSRWAFPTVALPLVEMAAAYLLFRALAEGADLGRRRRLFTLSGVTLGLGFYTHNAFWVFTAAVALFYIWEALSGRQAESGLAGKGRLLLLPALVIALPYLLGVLGQWQAFTEHVRSAAITRDAGFQALDGGLEQARYALANIGRSLTALFWTGGPGTSAAARLLDPLTAALTGLGLMAGAVRLKDRRHRFLWAVLVTTLVAAGLTREPGLYGRLSVALPVAFAAAGFGLDWLASWLDGRLGRDALQGLAVALVAVVVAYNLAAYFRDPGGVGNPRWLGAGQAGGAASLQMPVLDTASGEGSGGMGQ